MTTWHRCRPRDPDEALIDELLTLHARLRELEQQQQVIQVAIAMVASGEYEFIPESRGR